MSVYGQHDASSGAILPPPGGSSGPARHPSSDLSPSSEHREKHRVKFMSANSMITMAQHHFIAMTSEFVGTIFFLLFAFASAQIANTDTKNAVNTADTERLMYISISFGLSLLVNAWIFYRISGGLFNPAVTLGLVLSHQVPPLRGALLVVSQLVAGIVAAALASALFPGALNVNTTLGDQTNIAQGFFIEAFATFLLMMAVLMLAAEKSKATFLAPIGIGLTLFVTQLATVNFSGGSLNPTRSLGPAVVTKEFPTYHWIYWIGPGLGAVAASGFYHFIKYFNYEGANPGQDASDTS